jgi:Alpha/beta hydrolase of unknown function (DUF900)
MLLLSTRVLPRGGGVSQTVSIWDDGNHPRSLADMAKEIQGRDVLLVTHGFSVSQAEGETDLGGWNTGLTLGGVAVLGVLWPGDSRWIPKVDYVVEGNEAMASGVLLANFINDNFGGALSISFASHSLGARMVLQAIAGMSRKVRTLFLMAGAIDNTCLNDEFRVAVSNVQSLSVVASRSDDVLKWAFPAGNFLGGILSRGIPYIHEALGREGPVSPYPVNLRAGWQIPDEWNYGHENYLPDTNPMASVIAAIVDFPGPKPTDKSAWSAALMTGRFSDT